MARDILLLLLTGVVSMGALAVAVAGCGCGCGEKKERQEALELSSLESRCPFKTSGCYFSSSQRHKVLAPVLPRRRITTLLIRSFGFGRQDNMVWKSSLPQF
ncbi:hypothetical protein COLO4_11225 [Corchorus olitorius]|uniref:Uncharacterized protein n=1 Tax=Corchorus olitorius TaxID=93759 RepID=A0A1R3K5B7_9ROSI|nr:hypothetical protein COLO4_11225 [Corchorus olitorius]